MGIKKNCVFIFGFSFHSLSRTSCLNPVYDLFSQNSISNCVSFLCRKIRCCYGATLEGCWILWEMNSRLFRLSVCSYLSWLLSWGGRPPPTCFYSPPPCREDASRCSLHALSWPRGQPRTGPGQTKKYHENSCRTGCFKKVTSGKTWTCLCCP